MEEKVQKLSEGMDFIEESLGFGEPLQYIETHESIISESKSSKSASNKYRILGKCCGNFQPIGEFSRNKRLYSSDLWPRVLEGEELKSRLAHRAVFGCLGHADKLVDDKDIQEGKVSHIVTLLEVRKNEETGKPYLYGELEILDTPAGRILEAMYKGGADLYVSSRAAGKLYPAGNGLDYAVVRPDQYRVHTFDIVCRPGFLQARPTFEAVSDVETPSVIAETPVQESETPAVATVSESSEVSELKTQIEKLACVVEKVVDDMYKSEQVVSEEVQKQPIVEPKKEEKRETKELKCETKLTEESKAALISALMLLSELNVSEEALKEALDIMEDKLKG